MCFTDDVLVADWLYSLRLYDYVDLFEKHNLADVRHVRELGEAELTKVSTFGKAELTMVYTGTTANRIQGHFNFFKHKWWRLKGVGVDYYP